MKRFSKLSALLLGAALFATTLASCAPPAANSPAAATGASGSTAAATGGTAAAAGEKVVRVALTAEPESLDPTFVNSAPAQMVENHIQEPLMRSFGNEVRPGAAESYEVSEDGLVYTFKIRDGITWSDGVPVKAGDYEYGMKRFVDPANASPFAFMGTVLKNGAAVNAGEVDPAELGVKALDDTTLEVTLENPAGYFPSMLNIACFMPVRQDLVEQYGTEFANSAAQNVYSGPFTVKEWLKNDRVILEKNDSYWNKDTVKLNGAEFIVVADANTALSMFEAGDIDLADLNPTVAQQMTEVEYYYNGADDFMMLNLDEQYPTSNKNLRKALQFGFSRDEYITLVTADIYTANTRFVLPMVQGVEGEYGTEFPLEAFPSAGDIPKAKEYLDAAMKEMNITNPADIKLEILAADTDTARTEAEVLQAQWQKNLGITVDIRQVAYKQRLDMQYKGDFQMVSTGWMPDYSDPYAYLELFQSTANYNQGKFINAEYDAALAASVTEQDPQKRMEYLLQAEEILLEECAIIPTQLRRVPYVQNPNLTGVVHHFVGVMHNFVEADLTA